MALMKEAMSKKDYDRKEQGLPPLKVVKTSRPEPEKPIIKNEITMKDITDGFTVELESAKKRPIRNEDGVIFIGYDVVVVLHPVSKKKGKEDDVASKILEGWMLEGEFLTLVRTYSKQIDRQVIHG